MTALQEISVFLIRTLFDLYIILFVIRLLLGFARADFRNPISQFIVKATNPVLLPLRKIIPSIARIDTSAIVSVILLKLIQVGLLVVVTGGAMNIPAALWIVVGELLRLIVWVYIIALLVQAVISWVGSAHGNPVEPLLRSLTSPILKPIQKVVPPVAMMDLSPLVAIIGLQVVLIVLKNIGL